VKEGIASASYFFLCTRHFALWLLHGVKVKQRDRQKPLGFCLSQFTLYYVKGNQTGTNHKRRLLINSSKTKSMLMLQPIVSQSCPVTVVWAHC
jgi:hypothetical protein